MDVVTINSSFPPPVSRYWGVTQVGKFLREHHTRDAKEFQDELREMFIGGSVDPFAPGPTAVNPKRPPLGGDGRALAVNVVARPTDNRARRPEDVCRVLLDALRAAGVLDPKADIWILEFTRGPVQPGGRVQVTIAQVSAAAVAQPKLITDHMGVTL